ncbi:unnamed protein product [Ectocarpus fasciculatus]
MSCTAGRLSLIGLSSSFRNTSRLWGEKYRYGADVRRGSLLKTLMVLRFPFGTHGQGAGPDMIQDRVGKAEIALVYPALSYNASTREKMSPFVSRSKFSWAVWRSAPLLHLTVCSIVICRVSPWQRSTE